MDFKLTEEQSAFSRTARDFAQQEIAPEAAKWDAMSIFPKDTLRKAAELGFASIYVREDGGGVNLSRMDAALIFEELSAACPATAAYLSIHNMVSWLVDSYATPELRQHWLPKLSTMEAFSSYCLTEPGAGSDAAALKTTAVRDGDSYILNGAKAFISGGSETDLYACMVRTEDTGSKGISCVLVEKGTPGLSFGKPEDKLGWRSQPTTMVFFENCRVPIKNRVGAEGDGFKIALNALNGGRVNIAACSIGGAKACLQYTQKYMSERHQFNNKLADFQGLNFKFSDMITQWEAARLMVYRAAHSLDNKHPEHVTYCAMAKRYATDIGFKICDDALQLHGGYGYLRDYPIERYFRDLRVHQILEGTNEIMNLIIGRRTLHHDYVIE